MSAVISLAPPPAQIAAIPTPAAVPSPVVPQTQQPVAPPPAQIAAIPTPAAVPSPVVPQTQQPVATLLAQAIVIQTRDLGQPLVVKKTRQPQANQQGLAAAFLQTAFETNPMHVHQIANQALAAEPVKMEFHNSLPFEIKTVFEPANGQRLIQAPLNAQQFQYQLKPVDYNAILVAEPPKTPLIKAPEVQVERVVVAGSPIGGAVDKKPSRGIVFSFIEKLFIRLNAALMRIWKV